MNWYLEVLKKYAVFSGRARRKEFWFFTLFDTILLALLFGVAVGENYAWLFWLAWLYYLAVLIPRIAVQVRRLHDINRSGWWVLSNLVPLVGGLILLPGMVWDSQQGDNQYGPNPKQSSQPVAIQLGIPPQDEYPFDARRFACPQCGLRSTSVGICPTCKVELTLGGLTQPQETNALEQGRHVDVSLERTNWGLVSVLAIVALSGLFVISKPVGLTVTVLTVPILGIWIVSRFLKPKPFFVAFGFAMGGLLTLGGVLTILRLSLGISAKAVGIITAGACILLAGLGTIFGTSSGSKHGIRHGLSTGIGVAYPLILLLAWGLLIAAGVFV